MHTVQLHRVRGVEGGGARSSSRTASDWRRCWLPRAGHPSRRSPPLRFGAEIFSLKRSSRPGSSEQPPCFEGLSLPLSCCWAQRGDEVGVMSPAGSLSVRRGRMEVGDNSSEREAGVEGNSSLFQPEAFSSSEDERAFQTELTLTRRCCCGKDPMAQGWMQLEIHTLCFPLLSAPSRFSPLCPL